jgi:hypothetical protein
LFFSFSIFCKLDFIIFFNRCSSLKLTIINAEFSLFANLNTFLDSNVAVKSAVLLSKILS